MRAKDKIKSINELLMLCAGLRRRGLRVVFTNGCFDLLHVGHVRYLEQARELGDVLVVGINSDVSVRHIKGEQRPLVSQDERSEVLAAVHCVDYVTVFDEPDPLATIQRLQPEVLVKGADWPLEEIIGGQAVQHYGGQVVRISLVPEVSTSSIVERILARYARNACNDNG